MSEPATKLNGPIGEFITDEPRKPSGTVEGIIEPPSRTEKPQVANERLGGYDVADHTSFDNTGDIIYGTDSGIGDGPKRRGRKPGSLNKPKTGDTGTATGSTTAQKRQVDLGGLESILLSLHEMGAHLLKFPEFKLEKDEAQKLSASIQEVGKHYNWVVNPKHAAVTQLCLLLVTIYGLRFMVYFKEKPKPGPRLVPPMATPPAQQAQSPSPSQPKVDRNSPNYKFTPHELIGRPPVSDNDFV